MASVFVEGAVLEDSELEPLAGVSDIELIENPDGSQILIVASEARSALASYTVSPTGEIVFADSVLYSADSGTQVVSDIVEIAGPDGPLLLVLGRYDDNYAIYSVSPSGELAIYATLSGAGDQYARGLVGESYQIGSDNYFVTANYGTPGATLYRMDANGNVSLHQEIEDTEWRRMGDVTAIHYNELQGQPMVFIGSEQDAGMNLFAVRDDGTLSVKDRAVPVDYDGFYGVTAMDSVQFGDRAFVVMASAQTDTLTVARVSVGYQMNFIYEAEDTLDTRFEGVQDIEIVETDSGRVFVFAAGADDGITLFEMTYRGKLVHVDTIADDFDTTLGNVSSLDVHVEGEIAYVYAGSSSEHGVTQYVVDLSRSGEDIRGGPVKDVIVGTEFDDVIWGMGKSDELYGGAGDDRLIDGRGRDHLWGGPGADIFEFTVDGRSDFIHDFDPTEDRIDLTEFDVNHYDDITVGPRERGAAVLVGDEVIRLYNPDGGPYDMELFSEDNFIFL